MEGCFNFMKWIWVSKSHVGKDAYCLPFYFEAPILEKSRSPSKKKIYIPFIRNFNTTLHSTKITWFFLPFGFDMIVASSHLCAMWILFLSLFFCRALLPGNTTGHPAIPDVPRPRPGEDAAGSRRYTREGPRWFRKPHGGGPPAQGSDYCGGHPGGEGGAHVTLCGENAMQELSLNADGCMWKGLHVESCLVFFCALSEIRWPGGSAWPGRHQCHHDL